MTHQLEMIDFQIPQEHTIELAGSFSKSEHKKLNAIITTALNRDKDMISYRVLDHGKVVLNAHVLKLAINAYNDI